MADATTNFLVHGTPNEVLAARGDLRVQGACCASSATTKGCPYHRGVHARPNDMNSPLLLCPIRNFRGKDWRGTGPHNLGVEEAKPTFMANGVATLIPIRKTMTCYDVPKRQLLLSQQEKRGALRVVAWEGEVFPGMIGSLKKPDPENVGQFVHEDRVFTKDDKQSVIPMFPRPGEKPNMVDGARAAEIVRLSVGDEDQVTFDEAFSDGTNPEDVLDAAFGNPPEGSKSG